MSDKPAQNPVPAKRISNALAFCLWRIRQKNKQAQSNSQIVEAVGNDGTVTREQITPRTPLQ
jgi:hypothetical protein